MRSKGNLAIVFLLALVGTFLVLGFGNAGRGIHWLKSHLEIVERQLGSIEKLLQDYRDKHGCYPSNDEGLAVIDTFDSRFKMIVYCEPEQRVNGLIPLVVGRFFWQSSKDHIHAYREKHHRVPQNAEELRESNISSFFEDLSFVEGYDSVEVELAIGKDDELFFMSPAGIQTPWFIPYVYENRNGLDQSTFADSLAVPGEDTSYSVCVDKGVYVYSVGGALCAERLRKEWKTYMYPKLIGCGLIVAAVIIVVVKSYYSEASVLQGISYLIISGIAGVTLSSVLCPTCYMPGVPFRNRSPQMVERQRQLLDQFYHNGVINESTYQKALLTLENELASQPEDQSD